MTTTTVTTAPVEVEEREDDAPSAPAEVGPLDADLPPVPQGFTIHDDRTAGWVVGKMLGLDDERARLDASYEAMKADIARRKAALDLRFGDELRAYVETQLAARNAGKTKPLKTLRFLTGACVFRTQPAKVRVADVGRALAWVREHLVTALRSERVESIIHEELAAHVKATGELPPGVVVDDAVETFKVKAK